MKNKRWCVLFIGQGWVSKCSLFSVLKDAISMRIAFTTFVGQPYTYSFDTRSLRLQAFSQWGVDDLFPEVFPFQMMRFDVRSDSFYNHTLSSRRWSRCPPMLPLVVSLLIRVCHPFSWVGLLSAWFCLQAIILISVSTNVSFQFVLRSCPSLSSCLRSYLVLFHSSCSKQCR